MTYKQLILLLYIKHCLFQQTLNKGENNENTVLGDKIYIFLYDLVKRLS